MHSKKFFYLLIEKKKPISESNWQMFNEFNVQSTMGPVFRSSKETLLLICGTCGVFDPTDKAVHFL